MLDQSLLQSHFIGRDGFRWWIGQIPPLDSMGKQPTGGGWGNRFKVRILGYHPFDPTQLSNDDLPWAQALIPTTAGSGGAGCATGVQLQPGDMVLGFFLDGDNAQIPVILATFGKTDSVPSTQYKVPFQPFTGFSDLIKPNITLSSGTPGAPQSESNEVKENSQPTPQTLSPEQTKTPVNESVGDVVTLANTVQNTKISRIKAIITNLLKKLKRITGDIERIKREISKAVDNVAASVNEYVGTLLSRFIPKMEGLLTNGLVLLYEKVFEIVLAATGNPAAAHLAGVAAQEAMVIPVKLLEDSFKCITGTAMNLIKGTISEIIASVVDNVDRFVSCAADQFVGSILNSTIGILETLFVGPLAGVEKILQFFSDFNVGNLMRSFIDDFASGTSSGFGCNQDFANFIGLANELIIGGDMKFSGLNPYSNIQNIVNIASSGVDPKSIINCFSDALEFATPPIINIFGGPGFGASAIPIFGNIIRGSNGRLTGSVIGVQITDSGSGYTFPPFVEIVDDNEQGYGAVARSVINDKGEVTSIYMVSEGENYSVGDISQYSILEVLIQNGGSGYINGDIVIDDLGNKYDTQINNGRIYKVTPLNNIVDSLPVLTVETLESSSGSGAILRPLLGTSKSRFAGEMQKSIDCPI